MFLTSNDDIQLGDFGLSLTVNATNLKASKSFGTPSYNCPEMNKDNVYSFKSDIWLHFSNLFFVIYVQL